MKKSYFNGIIIPLIVMAVADILFIIAKWYVGEEIKGWFLCIPAFLLAVVGLIWLIVQLVKFRKSSNILIQIIIFFITIFITVVLFLLPFSDSEMKYKRNENAYKIVADAMFEAYDTGRISISDVFATPQNITYDSKLINKLFTKKFIRMMSKLNRRAGIYSCIMADKDVVYFSEGAFFQSISGIAICRHGKDPTIDEELHDRFFDGGISYDRINVNNVDYDIYYFRDGL